MLKRKILKMSMILLLILVFTVSMTLLLFFQTYPTSCKSSYDYVALGDSYSAGQTPYGITDGYSYTDMIRDKLASAGILGSYHKTGVSGYTTTDVIGQLPSIKDLLYHAEIVTMDIGINDILYLTEVAAYRSNPSSENFDAAQAAVIQKIPEIDSNIRVIISEIKAVNAYFDPQIYIMGYFNAFPNLPEFLPLIESLNVAISDVAVATGVTYVDTMAAIDGKLQEYLPGDIHPTVEGYSAIAEVFWKSMNENFLTITSAYGLPNDIIGHWAKNNIIKYMEEGIITGYEDGSFKPDHAVSRAEYVTIINKYFHLTAATDIDFTDVPEYAWYKTELQKAVKEGYILGYKDNSFRADEYVTRQEAAVIVAKIMKFELSEVGNEVIQFNDGKDIPSWSVDSVNALIRHGILKGYPDNFIRYQGNLTRAEVLSMLDKITAYINNNTPKVN